MIYNIPIHTEKNGTKLLSDIIHDIVCRGNAQNYTGMEKRRICQAVMNAVEKVDADLPFLK